MEEQGAFPTLEHRAGPGSPLLGYSYFTVSPLLACNLGVFSHLSLPNAGMTGMSHHVQLVSAVHPGTGASLSRGLYAETAGQNTLHGRSKLNIVSR